MVNAVACTEGEVGEVEGREGERLGCCGGYILKRYQCAIFCVM